MRDFPRVFRDDETLVSLALLVLVSGVALVFSMPSATFIHEILQSPMSRGTPLAFFVVHALSFSFFGINRGSAGIPLKHWRAQCLVQPVAHLILGLLFTIPYLIYIRIILLPLDRTIIVWIGAYSLIVSIFFALIAQWMEVRGTRIGRDTGLVRYAIAAAIIALPMAFHFAPPGVRLFSLLSPLSGMIRLYAGASAAELAVLFAMPPIGSLIALLLIRRESRWSRVPV
jgi:hypothetical protein